MKAKRALSDEQERLRIEGLRALARIIARRALAGSGSHVDGSAAKRPPAAGNACEGLPRERTWEDRAAKGAAEP